MMEDVHVKLKPVLPREKQPSTRRNFSPPNGLKFKKVTSKMLHTEHALCDAETGTLQKVDQKYLEIFEMWC
jgi:hypothetical protein